MALTRPGRQVPSLTSVAASASWTQTEIIVIHLARQLLAAILRKILGSALARAVAASDKSCTAALLSRPPVSLATVRSRRTELPTNSGYVVVLRSSARAEGYVWLPIRTGKRLAVSAQWRNQRRVYCHWNAVGDRETRGNDFNTAAVPGIDIRERGVAERHIFAHPRPRA